MRAKNKHPTIPHGAPSSPLSDEENTKLFSSKSISVCRYK